MSSDAELLLERQCLLQQDVVTGSNAVPVAFYEQSAFPFWTNRIEAVDIEWDGQDYYTAKYTIVSRLILAYFTEDNLNQAEAKIAQQIPVILDYYARRRQMKRTNADTALTNLNPMGIEIVNARALYGVLNNGIGANQFGVEFTSEVSFKYQVDQAVF